MLTFDEILAARTKLAEARKELRALVMRAESELDWQMLTSGFGDYGDNNRTCNAQVAILLGLTSAEWRAFFRRVDGVEPGGFVRWREDERRQRLVALEEGTGIPPWDENMDADREDDFSPRINAMMDEVFERHLGGDNN